MKKIISVSALVLLMAFVFNSCERCINCQIIGNSIDTLLLSDKDTIIYDEFCGSPSEVNAFENDVKYEAESRACKIYKIDRLDNGTNLQTYTVCGAQKNHEAFELTLDSIINTVYAGVDVRMYVDTTIINPGKWSCN